MKKKSIFAVIAAAVMSIFAFKVIRNRRKKKKEGKK